MAVYIPHSGVYTRWRCIFPIAVCIPDGGVQISYARKKMRNQMTNTALVYISNTPVLPLPALMVSEDGCQKTVSRSDESKKGKFLYSAVSSPQDRSKRFTLYFPDRPVHSDTISASLGNIQPYATINARRLLVYISTTVYSQVIMYSA